MAKAFDRDVDKPVVDGVEQIATARGVPMAHVALAWVLSKPVVACPIVGATKPHHLQDAVAALDLRLSAEEIADLERPYAAQDNFWWFMLAVALTSPLQAAAEEVFFRGYLQQALGTLAASPWVSVVGSAAIFAFYHGVQNLPLFLARFAFGLLAGWLVIRTGGLEAGIAAHVVNNVAAFVLAGLFDTISGARTKTDIGWSDFAWMTGGYALFALLAAVIAWKVGSRTRTAGSV